MSSGIMDQLFYFHHLQLAIWQNCDIVVKIGVVLDLLLLRENPMEPFRGDFVSLSLVSNIKGSILLFDLGIPIC